ncbi:MAG TPA: ABC transporter permease [Thermomicrobiales bacterium]|jgi:NitT/TauT family transport system permease protein|nr:ABC transporter permease [Thermomicrobiales bacterium]
MRRRRAAELSLTIAAPVVLLVVWEILSRTKTIDPLFWPPPSTLWDTVTTLVTEKDLLGDIRISLFRILGGFVIGTIPGIALGLAMGLFWPVRVFFMPLAAAIYAVPKIAVLPLVIIIFGIGETSKLMIVAVSIFFLVALNTMSGVLEIDRSYRDVARNLGATRWELFWTVALPGALPAIFTGMRLSLGFALIVIVGTEFLAADKGIGFMIWQSYQTLRIQQMFVGLIITGIMGWALTLLLDAIEHVVMPWRAER